MQGEIARGKTLHDRQAFVNEPPHTTRMNAPLIRGKRVRFLRFPRRDRFAAQFTSLVRSARFTDHRLPCLSLFGFGLAHVGRLVEHCLQGAFALERFPATRGTGHAMGSRSHHDATAHAAFSIPAYFPFSFPSAHMSPFTQLASHILPDRPICDKRDR